MIETIGTLNKNNFAIQASITVSLFKEKDPFTLLESAPSVGNKQS